jgi:type IV secretory pathway VirB2 component (pilin)
MDFLKGYLTYFAGFGLLVAGAVGMVINLVEPTHAQALPMGEAMQKIMEGIGLIGLRRAVANKPVIK